MIHARNEKLNNDYKMSNEEMAETTENDNLKKKDNQQKETIKELYIQVYDDIEKFLIQFKNRLQNVCQVIKPIQKEVKTIEIKVLSCIFIGGIMQYKQCSDRRNVNEVPNVSIDKWNDIRSFSYLRL